MGSQATRPGDQQWLQPDAVELQTPPADPVSVQALPWSEVGQVRAPHDGLFAQLTSHEHAFSHETCGQALLVSHITLHAPPPQVTLPHAPGDEHVMLQVGELHVTSPHAPMLVHSTLHGASCGQVIDAAPRPSITQVGGVVLWSQLEHCEAQAGSEPDPSVTQKPWLQVRPSMHSALLRHANCSDLRLTVHETAHSASATTSPFTSGLRS